MLPAVCLGLYHPSVLSVLLFLNPFFVTSKSKHAILRRLFTIHVQQFLTSLLPDFRRSRSDWTCIGQVYAFSNVSNCMVNFELCGKFSTCNTAIVLKCLAQIIIINNSGSTTGRKASSNVKSPPLNLAPLPCNYQRTKFVVSTACGFQSSF